MRLASQTLRPRSIPELLDAGVGIYRDHFLHFLGVAAVVNLPLGLLSALVTALIFSGDAPGPGRIFRLDTLPPEAIVGAVAAWLLLLLLAWLIGTFALAALLYSLQARLAGETPGVLAVYRASLSRVPALLGARLLFYLGAYSTYLPGMVLLGVGVLLIVQADGSPVFGGLLFTVGGVVLFLGGLALFILLYVRWRLHGQVCMLEGHGPVTSLRRSRELITGSWWRTLGFLILKFLFITAVSLTPEALVSLPAEIVAGVSTEWRFWASAISNSATVLTGILLLPIDVIATTMLYYDYRVRREALDLEMLVAELAGQEVGA